MRQGLQCNLFQVLFDVGAKRTIFLNGLFHFLVRIGGVLAMQVFHFTGIVRVYPDSILRSGVFFIVCHSVLFCDNAK